MQRQNVTKTHKEVNSLRSVAFNINFEQRKENAKGDNGFATKMTSLKKVEGKALV